MRKLKMKHNYTNGILITFCGLDGCGKTTIINKLTNDLQEEQAVYLTKQPTDEVRNTKIFRTYMDNADHSEFDYRSLSLLAASDRIQHVNRVILPEMDQGKIVISDRYFYSCLANLRARGYKSDKWIYDVSKSIICPDIAFFLDVPVHIAVDRVRERVDEKDRYIDMDLQYRLREEYLRICRMNHGVLISTEQSLEDTYDQVLTTLYRKTGLRI